MEESKSVDKIKEVVVYKLFQFYEFSDKKNCNLEKKIENVNEKLLYDTYQIFKKNLKKNPCYLSFTIKYFSKTLYILDISNNKEIKWNNLNYQIKHKIYQNLVNHFYLFLNHPKFSLP